MTEYTTSMTKQSFQFFYRTLSADTSLMRTLADMQSGVSERKAFENAEAIIQAVAAFEGTKASFQEDTQAVVYSFLQESPMLQGEHRMLQLHRLHFGLMLRDDEELVEALKQGATRESLFEKYYAAASQDETITEEVLTDAICTQLSALAVSPEVMTAIVRKLEDTNGMLPNAAAVSADGQRFQCILAMQLYLSNQDQGITFSEAATLACTTTEVHAIADAAGRGLITDDQITRAIEVIGAVVVLIGIFSTWNFFPSLVGKYISASAGKFLAANSLSLWLGGYLVEVLSEPLGALAGRLTATYHFTHAEEHAELMAGLHRMADAMKAKANDWKEKAAATVESFRPAAVSQDEDLADENVDPACAF